MIFKPLSFAISLTVLFSWGRAPAYGQLKPGVHPGWTLEELHLPQRYRIMGIDFLEDGRMVLATTQFLPTLGVVPAPSDSASIVVVSHYEDNDSSEIEVEVISEGWKDPSGINVVDNEIYVSDRDGHYKVLDIDHPADIKKNREKIISWPLEGWHQWVFTPIWRQGKFYAPYSGSLTLSGWSNAPATSELSGAFLSWDKDGDGGLEALAGGLRSPNGANVDGRGTMVVVDNQGSWLPASTFAIMKTGKFYGHRQSTPQAPNFAESLPYQKPAVWLPYGNFRKSPSQPIALSKGAYAGDWLVGDIGFTGLVRVSLDEVGGETQGAAFWFTQGFTNAKGDELIGSVSGNEGQNPPAINRLAFGPSGGLYIGSYAGIGGNWPDHTLMPMYVMRPKEGEEVFDFKSVRVVKDGLELGFTGPVDEESLPEKITAKVQRYQRDSAYGCCRQDLPSLTLELSGTSQDGLRAYYKGDLDTDVVLRISIGEVHSLKGDTVWNHEAFYTLNNLSDRSWDPYQASVAPRPARFPGQYRMHLGAEGKAQLQWLENAPAVIRLVDMRGRVCFRKFLEGKASVALSAPDQKPGVYGIRLESGGRSTAFKAYLP